MPILIIQRRRIRLGDILKPSDTAVRPGTRKLNVFSPLSALVLKISCSAETINVLRKEANGIVPASHLTQTKLITITLDQQVKCLHLRVFKYLLRISFKV